MSEGINKIQPISRNIYITQTMNKAIYNIQPIKKIELVTLLKETYPIYYWWFSKTQCWHCSVPYLFIKLQIQ